MPATSPEDKLAILREEHVWNYILLFKDSYGISAKMHRRILKEVVAYPQIRATEECDMAYGCIAARNMHEGDHSRAGKGLASKKLVVRNFNRQRG